MSDFENDPNLTKQSWLVGSDADCDVVIDLPRVSKQHFKLSRVDDHLTIEDLGSEHGTWVDGRPVVGPKRMRRGQRVTLGETIEFLWPPELLEFKSIMTIGRAESNDVVLDKPNISFEHARLIDDGEHLWIEDLDSTNGVCLNRPDNHVTCERVVLSDALYLGSTRITIARIISLALKEAISGESLANKVAERYVSGSRTESDNKRRTALMTGLAVGSLFGGALFSMWISHWLTQRESFQHVKPKVENVE